MKIIRCQRRSVIADPITPGKWLCPVSRKHIQAFPRGFFSLPGEIRNRIYEILLEPVVSYDGATPTSDNEIMLHRKLHISRVCQRLRIEYRPLALRSTIRYPLETSVRTFINFLKAYFPAGATSENMQLSIFLNAYQGAESYDLLWLLNFLRASPGILLTFESRVFWPHTIPDIESLLESARTDSAWSRLDIFEHIRLCSIVNARLVNALRPRIPSVKCWKVEFVYKAGVWDDLWDTEKGCECRVQHFKKRMGLAGLETLDIKISEDRTTTIVARPKRDPYSAQITAIIEGLSGALAKLAVKGAERQKQCRESKALMVNKNL